MHTQERRSGGWKAAAQLTFPLVTTRLRGPAQAQTLVIRVFVTNQSSSQTKVYNCHEKRGA